MSTAENKILQKFEVKFIFDMKIQSYKVDDYIKNIENSGVYAVLLYGPDAGLVSVRFNEIAKKIVDDLHDPFRVADISAEQIKENPTVVADEFLAMSMLGGRRLIKIRSAKNDVSKLLEDIIALPKGETTKTWKPKGDNFILISAGDLDAKSTLRKFAEQEDYMVALPCYADDTRAILQIINAKLREYGFTYHPDIANILASKFGGDRLIIINEIDKLALFMGDDKEITMEDMESCISDVSESQYDELINAFADFDNSRIMTTLSKLYLDGTSPISLIRTLANYFLNLQLVKSAIESGVPEDEAMRMLRPPLFYKQIPFFKKHLQSWSSKNISSFLQKLLEVEIECKKTGSASELLLGNLLNMGCIKYRRG